MSKTIAIVTGSSRGLGAALASQLATQVSQLITIARTDNMQLHALALQHGCHHVHNGFNLSNPEHINAAALDIFLELDQSASQYILINNAGTLGPVGQYNSLGHEKAQDIASAFNLNVNSVIMLTSAFLAATRNTGADVRVINISSGAGRSPTPGWSVYCATKAALDMYTRVARQEAPHARLVSLAPGVIDTGMQKQIRELDPGDFPNRARFTQLHEKGELSNPEQLATKILNYLHRDDFGQTEIDDIRHYS
ncbi:SDR family NAD(P)-dependent oxidoreductase [Advenella sp. RU8]|uniref:SDR family NAD(P)-dependent oxidoreductase n=1 Tax=Advenella sp. RU8 TaxID=3399575 RepID=UPI003AAADF2F